MLGVPPDDAEDVIEAWFDHLDETCSGALFVLADWLRIEQLASRMHPLTVEALQWPHRRHVVNWMHQVATKLAGKSWSGATVPLAVALLDSYGSRLAEFPTMKMTRRQQYAIMAAALLLASKMYDLRPLRAPFFLASFVDKDPPRWADILAAETNLGNFLSWRLHRPTVYTFLALLHKAHQVLYPEAPALDVAGAAWVLIKQAGRYVEKGWTTFQMAVGTLVLHRLHNAQHPVWPDPMAVFASCGLQTQVDSCGVAGITPLPPACFSDLRELQVAAEWPCVVDAARLSSFIASDAL